MFSHLSDWEGLLAVEEAGPAPAAAAAAAAAAAVLFQSSWRVSVRAGVEEVELRDCLFNWCSFAVEMNTN